MNETKALTRASKTIIYMLCPANDDTDVFVQIRMADKIESFCVIAAFQLRNYASKEIKKKILSI